MNNLHKRLKQAERRGVYILARGQCPQDFYPTDRDKFDIYVESEGLLGPRNLALSKREAILLAYRISVSKRSRIAVKTVDYRALCIGFGIHAHKIADTCFAKDAPAEDQQKWFVSVPGESSFASDVASLPDFNTEDDAYYAAYKHWNLESMSKPLH